MLLNPEVIFQPAQPVFAREMCVGYRFPLCFLRSFLENKHSVSVWCC